MLNLAFHHGTTLTASMMTTLFMFVPSDGYVGTNEHDAKGI